jgi:predicted GIY-YIG superfamily endonuclease
MSCIYVIGPENGPYKIGITKDINRRIKSIQTGNPFKLFVHHEEPIPEEQLKFIETQIHKNLSHKRSKGEWFNITLDEAISHVKFARIRYLKD